MCNQNVLKEIKIKKIIISNSYIMMGKSVIAGTRITVELILKIFAANESIEEILVAHPRFTREVIQAGG